MYVSGGTPPNMPPHSYGSHRGSLFCAEIEFDAQDLSSFPQKLSWTHKIRVRRDELRSCGLNSISLEKSEPPWLPYTASGIARVSFLSQAITPYTEWHILVAWENMSVLWSGLLCWHRCLIQLGSKLFISKSGRKIFLQLKLLCYSWNRCGSFTFVAINITTWYLFWLICIRFMWFQFRIGQNW